MSKNIEMLKFSIFIAEKILCILHGRVFVMNQGFRINKDFKFSLLVGMLVSYPPCMYTEDFHWKLSDLVVELKLKASHITSP